MDKIEFNPTKIEYGADGFESDAADIFINGKNFLDAIHAYEKVHNINGGHVPITTYELYQSLAKDYLKNSVPIYGCGCGVIDCSPVYVKISVDDEIVTWDNFKFPQAFADKFCPKFEKQTFDKKQYFDEIDKLKHWIFDKSAVIEYTALSAAISA